jgi:hypothetical protein
VLGSGNTGGDSEGRQSLCGQHSMRSDTLQKVKPGEQKRPSLAGSC